MANPRMEFFVYSLPIWTWIVVEEEEGKELCGDSFAAAAGCAFEFAFADWLNACRRLAVPPLGKTTGEKAMKRRKEGRKEEEEAVKKEEHGRGRVHWKGKVPRRQKSHHQKEEEEEKPAEEAVKRAQRNTHPKKPSPEKADKNHPRIKK
jgi:hypothetical protein